jgi:hypothetical protein
MIILFVIPFFGLIKNYVKYKKINLYLFFRTPIICYFIQLLIQSNNIYKILLYERWFMFIYKILKSLYNNDYQVRKVKYIKKYKLRYEENINKINKNNKVTFK